MRVRARLDRRQALLEADGDQHREGRARRHAGDLLMADDSARQSDLTAGPGGVMTDEVGVITGDLTLRSELTGGNVILKIQYKDAAEWYAVTGGKASLKDPADLDAVHSIALALLHRPSG
ncbi:hypothetical protein AB0J74_32500 [Asanoa sp. NPDC049573]|uniref:hypothetical protein n=1 Tax=Asanoa sp. NPDC049573 TaxID=3155396 RepID=UPI00343C4745